MVLPRAFSSPCAQSVYATVVLNPPEGEGTGLSENLDHGAYMLDWTPPEKCYHFPDVGLRDIGNFVRMSVGSVGVSVRVSLILFV